MSEAGGHEDDERERPSPDGVVGAREDEEEPPGASGAEHAAAVVLQRHARGLLTRRRFRYVRASQAAERAWSGMGMSPGLLSTAGAEMQLREEYAGAVVPVPVHACVPPDASLVRMRAGSNAAAAAALASLAGPEGGGGGGIVGAVDDACFLAGERLRGAAAAPAPPGAAAAGHPLDAAPAASSSEMGAAVSGGDSRLRVHTKLRMHAAAARLKGLDAHLTRMRGALEVMLAETSGSYAGLPPDGVRDEGYRSLMLMMTLGGRGTEQHRDGAGGIDALRPGSLAYLDELVQRVAAEKAAAERGARQRRGGGGRRKSVAGSGAAAAAAVRAAGAAAGNAAEVPAAPASFRRTVASVSVTKQSVDVMRAMRRNSVRRGSVF